MQNRDGPAKDCQCSMPQCQWFCGTPLLLVLDYYYYYYYSSTSSTTRRGPPSLSPSRKSLQTVPAPVLCGNKSTHPEEQTWPTMPSVCFVGLLLCVAYCTL